MCQHFHTYSFKYYPDSLDFQNLWMLSLISPLILGQAYKLSGLISKSIKVENSEQKPYLCYCSLLLKLLLLQRPYNPRSPIYHRDVYRTITLSFKNYLICLNVNNINNKKNKLQGSNDLYNQHVCSIFSCPVVIVKQNKYYHYYYFQQGQIVLKITLSIKRINHPQQALFQVMYLFFKFYFHNI